MSIDSPRPEKPDTKPDDGGMASLIRAERLTQIAFILPAAVFIGWVLGVLLDKWLHQHWIYIVGIILGSVAGFIQIFRLVAASGKNS